MFNLLEKSSVNIRGCVLKFGLVAAFGLLLTAPAAWADSEKPPLDSGSIFESTKEKGSQPPQKNTPEVNRPVEPLSQADNGQKVLVKQIHIVGQDLFPEIELTALLQDQIGQTLGLGELQAAAGRVGKYFRDRGYLVARALLPAQQVTDGTITIQVVVGQYGRIDIRNTSRLSDQYLAGLTKALQSGDYIRQDKLERTLLLTGDTNGIALKSTLAPGQAPGTADLILEVSDAARVNGQVAADNWGNRYTGATGGKVNANISNLCHWGDTLTLGGLYAGSGLNNYDLGYSIPIGTSGVKLGINYAAVDYELGKSYESLDATGTAKVTGLSGSYPLLRSRKSNLTAQLGLERKKFGDELGTAGTDSEKAIKAWQIGLSGNRRDADGSGVTGFEAALHRGKLSLDSKDAISDDTDLRAAGYYTKTTFGLLRQEYIKPRLSYSLTLNGQLANKNLNSSEKLSLGGASGVRAYPQGEASGDQGFLVSAELHWDLPGSGWQLATFVDAGRVIINKDPVSSASDNERTLSGAGVGLLFNRSKDYSFRLDCAFKLSSDEATSDEDRDGRIWLRGVRYF